MLTGRGIAVNPSAVKPAKPLVRSVGSRTIPPTLQVQRMLSGCVSVLRILHLKVGLAESAEIYQWSSAKTHISGTVDSLLGTNSWLSLQEQASYAEFVRTEDEETDSAIRRATSCGRPFGSEVFIDLLEFRLNQPLKPKRPGRPCSKTGECS